MNEKDSIPITLTKGEKAPNFSLPAINSDGTEIEIGFNSKYILEMINNLEDDEIVLTLKDNSSPITATERSNPDLIYVLMPMRV